MSADAPEYLVEHVHQALARDPRTNELEIEVRIVGDKCFLTGIVATTERQRAVEEVAAEVLRDHEIHNATQLADLSEPAEAEQLP